MEKMSIGEMKETNGGAISGNFLVGLGNIIEGITNFIGNIAGLSFAFSGMDQKHSKGDFKFSKNLSFNWDDTKGKTENIVKVNLDALDHLSNHY